MKTLPAACYSQYFRHLQTALEVGRLKPTPAYASYVRAEAGPHRAEVPM